MRSLIISIFLLFVLVVTPKHVFAEPLSDDFPYIDVADIFYAPMFNDTGLFGAFGGYCGGDSGGQIVDWSIGNTIPHSDSMTGDIVFSTSVGNIMQAANWKERMRITKDGNVSIGTTSLANRLSVSGSSDIDGTMLVTGDAPFPTSGAGVAMQSDGVVAHVFGYDYGALKALPLVLQEPGGNVGIGTKTPAAPLVIKDDDFSNVLFQDTDTGGTNSDGFFVGINTTENAVLWNWENKDMYFGTNNTMRMIIKAGGDVGIGTTFPNYKLDVRGNIGNNTTLYHSDIRWKKNVSTLKDALDKVTDLRGVNFEWRANEFPEMVFSEGTKVGFIAQEVEEILPELVSTEKDGFKSVQYANIVPLLVEAIKELRTDNDELRKEKDTEVATLQAENKQLRETLTSMADRQKSIEDMLLALSSNFQKEKLVKLDQVKLSKVQ